MRVKKNSFVLFIAFVILFSSIACINPGFMNEIVQNTPHPSIQPTMELIFSKDISVIVTPTPVPPAPSPTPTATPTPEPTPEPSDPGLARPEDEIHYAIDTSVITDNSYITRNISVNITEVVEEKNAFSGQKLVYYIADIYIRDVTNLKRAYANNNFKPGILESINDMHNDLGAVVTMSGDFCSSKFKSFVICNGEVLHQSKNFDRDLCVLYKDGSMECYAPEDIDVEYILSKNPWQSWNFGPILLDPLGSAASSFNLPDHISASNPRAVIGYYAPGHYCLIVVDGRSSRSLGLKMNELALFVESLGCKAAYNLDGGLTAQMAFGSDRINNPVDNRRIKDVVYIVDPDKEDSQS